MTLDGKRDFVDGLKLRILRWRDYPELSRWADIITIVKRRVKTREGGVTTEVGVMLLLVLECRQPPRAGKNMERILPSEPTERMSTAHTLVVVQLDF